MSTSTVSGAHGAPSRGAPAPAHVATLDPVPVAGGAVACGGAVVHESRDAIASVAKDAWGRLSPAFER